MERSLIFFTFWTSKSEDSDTLLGDSGPWFAQQLLKLLRFRRSDKLQEIPSTLTNTLSGIYRH